MSDAEEKGFTVSDKRHFTENGETEPEESGPAAAEASSGPETETEAKAQAGPADQTPPRAGEETEPAGPQGEALPEVSFPAFIISLSSSAMLQLGLIPDPQTGQSEVNLPLAKQTIDLIALIKEKTKGNLDGDEEKLMDGVLYDLRMTYVQAVKQYTQAAKPA